MLGVMDISIILVFYFILISEFKLIRYLMTSSPDVTNMSTAISPFSAILDQ